MQPTDTFSGFAFFPAITVQAQDQFGNNVATNNLTVTLGVASGSAALSGSVTVDTDGTGLATFNSVTPNGNGMITLSASAAGFTSGTSTNFNLSGASADTVVFATQPTNNVAGATLGEVDVLATTSGNPLPGVAVQLTVAGGTGSLGGTVSQTTDINGFAHFTDLSFSNAGGRKQLEATSGSATADSGSFSITNAIGERAGPRRAALLSADRTAGIAFAGQPAVWVEDMFGKRLVSNSTASVTGGAVRRRQFERQTSWRTRCPSAADGTTGTATFFGLYLTNATAGNTLTFTSSGLTGTNSTAISVTAAVPGLMSMNTQPSSTSVAGVAFATQPVVNVVGMRTATP